MFGSIAAYGIVFEVHESPARLASRYLARRPGACGPTLTAAFASEEAVIPDSKSSALYCWKTG